MKLLPLTLLALITFQTTAAETTMKHTLKDQIKLNSDAKIVKVLSSPSFKLIGLGFKKEQMLEKHSTSSPAILIVQAGSVDFKMSGKTHVLKAGDYFEIPVNVEHEVIGREDTYLYLVK